jgi:hypothetical protein
MTGNVQPPQLDPSIGSLLGRLRLAIRRYVLFDGGAKAAAWLGAAFWLSLLVDWIWEPPTVVRGIVLVAVGSVLVWLVIRYILLRAFARLPDRNMAMLLERNYPRFNETLITAVELSWRDPAARGCNPEMLDRTCRQAARSVGAVDLARVFNPAPLRESVLAAVLLAASIGLFGLAAPQMLSVWARRNLAFSDELWPRKTRLVIEGFPDGVAKVGRGADLEVIAKADLNKPLVPKVVEVRFETEAGARGRKPMTRVGMADAARDRFQEYSHTFQSVLTGIQFDVVGGDDALRGLRIEAVDRPAIIAMELACRFPRYTARDPRTMPVTGVMQIPMGTHVTIYAEANKELVHARVESALSDKPEPPLILKPQKDSDPPRIVHTLESLDEDQTLLFELLDTDGIKSREPIRLALAAVADQPPELSVRLQGIGTAITPQARLPAVGTITDEYGLARVWFEHRADEAPASESMAGEFSGNPTEIDINRALDVRQLGVEPGNQLVVSLKAADRCDLDQGPNVGSSQQWLLEVVTPERLRTILEARELVLRERFESILREVIETRDSLEALDFPKRGGDPQDEPPKTVRSEPTDGAVEDSAQTSGSSDEANQSQAESAQESLAQLRLRVQRAQQNGKKEAQEVLGVSEGFDEIREQLVNNRIDTEELKDRLDRRIAQPLRQIAEDGFPELDQRLTQLEAALADPRAGPENRRSAVQQLDAIIRAMREVLSRMIELEDFNQAIALLREIIEAQEKLMEETKTQQKEKLRGLLED